LEALPQETFKRGSVLQRPPKDKFKVIFELLCAPGRECGLAHTSKPEYGHDARLVGHNPSLQFGQLLLASVKKLQSGGVSPIFATKVRVSERGGVRRKSNCGQEREFIFGKRQNLG